MVFIMLHLHPNSLVYIFLPLIQDPSSLVDVSYSVLIVVSLL